MATARKFEELVAWKLAERTREEVFRLTTRQPVADDRRFCEQIQSSARSAPANLAEEFGRYHPKPFKLHATIARASLDETRNHTYDGYQRGHFSEEEHADLLPLLRRASAATTRLIRYLATCKNAPDAAEDSDSNKGTQPRTLEPRTRTLEPEPRTPERQNLEPEK